jgi:hypothetical protein
MLDAKVIFDVAAALFILLGALTMAVKDYKTTYDPAWQPSPKLLFRAGYLVCTALLIGSAALTVRSLYAHGFSDTKDLFNKLLMGIVAPLFVWGLYAASRSQPAEVWGTIFRLVLALAVFGLILESM